VNLPDAEIVNVVGGGTLNEEVDLLQISSEIGTPISRYDPEHHPSLILKITEDGATVMLFRTGKYNIAGASSVEDLRRTNKIFLKHIFSLDPELASNIGEFEVRNIVFNFGLDTEFDLSVLALGLGLDHAEYEPEQFPGIQYRLPDGDGVFLIFRTGSVLLTGTPSEIKGYKQIAELKRTLSELNAI
jgi:transcription initiation factor TFIID TATA-box-binding protein